MALKRKSEKPRKTGRRKQNPIIFIVCEGKDTEVSYFKNFNSRYTRVDVRIADKGAIGKNKGKYTDPENIVKKAKNIVLENKDIINEENGDRVWCVFDTDINYNNNNAVQSKVDEINKAKNIANKHKIRLGISNPCFELWYLLHFEYTTANLKNYDEVKNRLIKYIQDYDKNKNVYKLLKDNIKEAIKNTGKLKEYHLSLDRKIINTEKDYRKIDVKSIVESNPYTSVVDLICYMEEMNNKNK